MSTDLLARSRISAWLSRGGRPAALVAAGVVLVVVVGLLSVLLWPRQALPGKPAPMLGSLAVGALAPRVQLADSGVRGGSVSLPESGEVTLVSFLATQPDTANSPSRSQAVVLVSLASQYSAKGLRVVIVDESSISVSASALENTGYDWRLGAVQLLADPGHVAALRYGVSSAPASLLIGRNGRVLERWPGYVLTAVAAQPISAALAEGPMA